MTTDTPQQTIEYVRDPRGTLFAVERVRAAAWDPAYLDPPACEIADVRIVELRTPADLDDLPGWLRLEVIEDAPFRVAEAVPVYVVSEAGTATGLWNASPYFTITATSVDDYIRAAASAILAPAPAPYEAARCALTVRRYASTSLLFGPFVVLEADVRERWLHRTFAHADALAYEVLLERLAIDAPEIASTLRFLRDAEIAGNAEFLDFAFDRQALLEQASPWRYYESPDDFGPALAAVRGWIRRYRGAYANHYHAVVAASRAALRDLESIEVTANALRQLNALAGIGRATGIIALHALDRSGGRLSALAEEPDQEAARTSDVTLGARHPAIEDARNAAAAVRAALEVQRRRLAQHAAHLVLDREEVPALDRLLQALTAADVDGIERILDARLTAHIDQLIA